MLSVLLGHAYFLRFDSKQFERARPYPPLATLQAATVLRQAGRQVWLFDAMLAEGTHEFEARLGTHRPALVLLYEDNFNYLSKMCLGKMRSASCEMIGSARRAGARVIVGGSDASDAPEVYLRAGADVVLVGEGLAALLLLLPRLDADPQARVRELVAGIAGVATLDDGQLVRAAGGTPMPAAQLDETPAWDLVDIDRYRAVWMQAQGSFSLNMAASKGCSFRCAWCAKPIWGNRYLQREATAVAAEMTWLKRRFRPDHIWFADDIFGMRADWVCSFARAVQAADGAIPFTIQTRADLVTEAMARALALAGCTEVWIGAESGSQRILDAMDKGTTVEEIVTARARLQAQRIRVGFFIQLGYLGEQLDDLVATRKLLECAEPDDIGVSVSYPLPGTRFYDRVKHQLGDKSRWEESNDLAMMFRGTYDSAFYREVRDLLHRQVQVQKLHRSSKAAVAQPALSVLQARWDALVAREAQHRTAAPIAIMAG